MLTSMCLCSRGANGQISAGQLRPRIVVTTDPELDDNNSLIRFLLYSCDLQVEGLVYASSGYHWAGDGKGTKWYVPGREYARFGLDTCPCTSSRWARDEHYIDNAVEAYKRAYPNLKVHNSSYPEPSDLKSKIRVGNIAFDGDISKDSPGSDLIKSLILDDKPGKLYLTAWGGQSTIARALKSIQEQYENSNLWPLIKEKIIRKVVLLPSGDQDDTYAEYIGPNWPGIEYRQFRDSPNYGYGAQLHAKPEDSVYMTSRWMTENISSRGPLGALYRVWGDGKQMVKGDIMDYFGLSGFTDGQLRKMGYVVWMPVQEKGSWLGEGDDPTFMNMLGNGLRAWEEGTYGGWGGRVLREPASILSIPSGDTSQQAMIGTLNSLNQQVNQSESSYPDFFPAAQRDFAARLIWSVTPEYSDANHSPVVTVEGPLTLLASPGQAIRLKVKVSDPDNDRVSVRWWQFPAGTYRHPVDISGASSLRPSLLIPGDATAGQTIHLIVEATDNGTPVLTSYQRIIITIH